MKKEKKPKIFICEWCQKRFKSKYGGLYPHIQSKHFGISYICNLCFIKISRWYNLQRHKKICYKKNFFSYLPSVAKEPSIKQHVFGI